MRKLFLLLTFLLATTALFAQKPFQGYIKYSFKIMGENAEMMESMMPTSMELYSSKKNMMVKMNGGMMGAMMGDMLSSPKESYMIKHDEKTAYLLKNPEEAKDNAKVVKEDEVITIQGHSCQKYKVTKTDTKGEQTAYIWITKDYKLPVTGGKGAENMAVPGIPGIAMKIMTSQGGVTVVISAIEIKAVKQDKKYFTFPKGYAKKDFVAGAMGI